MNSKVFADKMVIFLKNHKTYNEREELLVHYGLETIYIFITKLTLITLFSLILNITKEMYIFIFFYFFLRFYGSGLHLEKSIHCTIASLILLLGFPLLSIKTIIPLGLRIIISGISITIFSIFSPADTHKKPLINKNKRIKLKIKTCLVGIIYFILINIIKNNFILNCITYSLILESLLILPITYKLFNMPYNNYINYKKN